MRTPHTARVSRFLLLIALAMVAAGCGSLGDQKPAIEKAIREHLARRSDLAINQMVMEMKEVKVEGDAQDRAGAYVVFRVTNDPEMQMGYHYDLAREDGAWKVLGGRPAQANSSHPGASADPRAADPRALPPGHPPVSGGTVDEHGHDPSGAMPPGHPPLGAPAPDSSAMPPGHP